LGSLFLFSLAKVFIGLKAALRAKMLGTKLFSKYIIAPCLHIVAQQGSPSHRSHLVTSSVFGSILMAPNGQADKQFLQPTHSFLSITIAPVVASRFMALKWHASMHLGLSQCLQITG
jgi:hypothetical protein